MVSKKGRNSDQTHHMLNIRVLELFFKTWLLSRPMIFLYILVDICTQFVMVMHFVCQSTRFSVILTFKILDCCKFPQKLQLWPIITLLVILRFPPNLKEMINFQPSPFPLFSLNARTGLGIGNYQSRSFIWYTSWLTYIWWKQMYILLACMATPYPLSSTSNDCSWLHGWVFTIPTSLSNFISIGLIVFETDRRFE